MSKLIMIIGAACAALLLLAACGGGSGSSNLDTQRMVVEKYNLGTTERQLKLRGPQRPVSAPVTYYIFGSTKAIEDGGMVPLQSDRLDEKSFGPFSAGQAQITVDLSEWSSYTYVYVRAIPVEPNVVVGIEKGKLVDIWTS